MFSKILFLYRIMFLACKVNDNKTGMHIIIPYTYLYSAYTGPADVVSNKKKTGTQANSKWYCLLMISRIHDKKKIRVKNPILKTIDRIG